MMDRVPVWLTRRELEWLAANASEPLAGRARAVAASLAKREAELVTTTFNSTWDEPLEAELQSRRPLLPLWELSKEQLQQLYDYLCAT